MPSPTPQELQKDFEEFIHNKYGDSVNVVTHFQKYDAQKDDEGPTIKKGGNKFDFNLSPKEIKKYLDRFVIKQDQAKKTLAIAVCDHYNHVRQYLKDPLLSKSSYAKQNVLLMGPTGVGKTYLVSLIADMLGVPFVKADATTFTEAGYVGANVDDMVKDLVQKAGGDINLAQFGIIYLDEADKLATPPNILGRDVSGRGVQFGLLKLMEETDVDLKTGGDIAGQLKAFAEFQQKGKVEKQIINTRHILFIVSGAFNGAQEIIKKRIGHGKISLAGERSKSEKAKNDEINYLEMVETSDLVSLGFEPEFVGRLPVRVACEHLEASDLEKILGHAEGSILKQYEKAFSYYEIEIHFAQSGIRKIAELAAKEKTGARSLMTICERTLREFKFELPGSGVPEFVVDQELMDDPKGALENLLQEGKRILEAKEGEVIGPSENLFKVGHERLKKFKHLFHSLYGLNIHIPMEVEKEIINRAYQRKQKPEIFCEKLLENHHEAIELLHSRMEDNSLDLKSKIFSFTSEGLDYPDKMLEDWVRSSFTH